MRRTESNGLGKGRPMPWTSSFNMHCKTESLKRHAALVATTLEILFCQILYARTNLRCVHIGVFKKPRDQPLSN